MRTFPFLFLFSGGVYKNRSRLAQQDQSHALLFGFLAVPGTRFFTQEEAQSGYEQQTGAVIVERFKGLSAVDRPRSGQIVSSSESCGLQLLRVICGVRDRFIAHASVTNSTNLGPISTDHNP